MILTRSSIYLVGGLPTDSTSSGLWTPLEKILAPSTPSSTSDVPHPLLLESSDSSSYVGDFSSGADLISDFILQRNYKDSPLRRALSDLELFIRPIVSGQSQCHMSSANTRWSKTLDMRHCGTSDDKILAELPNHCPTELDSSIDLFFEVGPK